MTGGLMQLVAIGAQDIYLTSNPTITYFKLVYRRHTNFAMESVRQTFNSFPDFGKTVSSIISRQGDLISGIYLQTTLPDLPADDKASNYCAWTDDIGHHLIKRVDLEIGGQLIDRHYGDWLEIWAQLTVPAGKMKGYREMIGQDPRPILNLNSGLQRDRFNRVIKGKTIYVPLQFWFCRNIGLALPLIALQYHEVKITVEFRPFESLISSFKTDKGLLQNPLSIGSLKETDLWVNYIYLDVDERRRFAQVNHEYLIEQVQFNTAPIPSSVNQYTHLHEMAFQHPVKEIIWVVQSLNATSDGHVQWSNYTDRSAINFPTSTIDGILNLKNLGSIIYDVDTTTKASSENLQSVTNPSHVKPPGSLNPLISAKIILNGNDRFAEQSGFYFNKYQTMKHHTNVPESPGINVYSFCLKPENHQPSGTCNFSRINKAHLQLTLSPGANHSVKAVDNVIVNNFVQSSYVLKVYAVNYNIFRIMSGMGAIAYVT